MDAHLTCAARCRFPDGTAVVADLEVPAPGFSVTVLFGPSGSGKTTVLRLLAGLARTDQGTIRLGKRTWADAARGIHLSPQARNIGFLAQDPALFPHLTVAQNLAYGLAGQPRAQRAGRVAELLALLGLEGLDQRRPGDLSGGQRQRVALGRALARRPSLLLLDEPLSALDLPTRLRLRGDLRALLRALDLPTVLVTHDRSEALHLGDRVVVMDQGRPCQHGDLREVFDRPRDPATARILGVETVVKGRVEGVAEGLATLAVGSARLVAPDPGGLGREAYACIRGEDVAVARLDAPPPESTARNRLPGTVTFLHPEGALVRVGLDCGFPLEALATRQACADLALAEGRPVAAVLKAAAIHLVPHD